MIMTCGSPRCLVGRFVFALGVLIPTAFSTLAAQDPPAAPPPPPPQQDRNPPAEIRPYDRVITKEAKSDAGIFTVHRIGEKLYYEIPKAQLNREFLWVSQIARTAIGAGQGGQPVGNRVVKWERH